MGEAGSGFRVLIVEDAEADVLLMREAIEAANSHVLIDVVYDGEEAIRFFDRLEAASDMPSPDLVILDINLPKRQGSEVLRHMRQSQRCRNGRVIAVSTSDSEQDRQRMSALGADVYFRKPSEFEAFMKLGDVVKELLDRSK